MKSKKKVLIISRADDRATLNVQKWLRYYNTDFTRLNFEDHTKITYHFDDNSQVGISIFDSSNNLLIESKDIKSVWYRRGDINNFFYKESLLLKDIQFENLFRKHLDNENSYYNELIHLGFYKYLHINNRLTSIPNKLWTLNIAAECGLMVPPSMVTCYRKDVLNFHKNNNEKIISKAIRDGISFNIDDYYFTGYTELLPYELINQLNDEFFPTLFQAYIEKQFEIRTFFLNNTFYSTAIFSQNDQQTQVDFRKYNYSYPNRTPCFVLPMKVQESLRMLLKRININCGSIDLIKGKDNNIYFLEINPVGQFAQVSTPGNFYLEKQIAEYLIS